MNFTQFLQRQKLEDRQAFIVHYGACGGKTRFAKQLSQQNPGFVYFDLLEEYLANSDLPGIKDLGPKRFQEWLLGLACPQSTNTMILDHGDFLFNTWSAEQKEQLLHWLRRDLRTPATTDKTLVFFIQTDGMLSNAQIENSRGEARVLSLNEFDAI